MKIGFVIALSLSCFLMSAKVHAQLSKVEVTWESTAVKKSGSLFEQKLSQRSGDWKKCTALAEKNFRTTKDLRGWILLSWVQCSIGFHTEIKGQSINQNLLKTIETHPELFVGGIWSESLLKEVMNLKVLGLTSKRSWPAIEDLLQKKGLLTREGAAVVYGKVGEQARIEGNLEAAIRFFTISLKLKEEKVFREQLASLLLATRQAPEADTKVESVTKNQWNPREAQLEERMNQSLKQDVSSFFEDAIEYLSSFPGGSRATWVKDSVSDIFVRSVEKINGDQALLLRDKWISTLAKADKTIGFEWARYFYRQGEYLSALELIERIYDSTSPQGGSQALIAGKSAQALGQFVKAQRFFEIYAERFSGGSDIVEVLYRLGLVHIRRFQYSSAVAVFERMLSYSQIDRHELSARYWMVYALEQSKNPRASVEKELILTKYPLTFYGLLLRAEKANGELSWPTAQKLSSRPKFTWVLTRSEKEIYNRFLKLAENDWIEESRAEAKELNVESNPELLVLLSQKAAARGVFGPSLGWSADAFELNPLLRSFETVQLTLGKPYRKDIKENSEKNQLSELLVYSLIRQESAFNPDISSSAQAKGLMQLLQSTAQEVALQTGREELKAHSLFDPTLNIRLGTRYLSQMLNQHGKDIPKALAAYNAGPRRVKDFFAARSRFQDDVPHLWYEELSWLETSIYIKTIQRNLILYSLAESIEKNGFERARVQLSENFWKSFILSQP